MSLELTDVTLTYPDGDARLTALDQVSLTVPAGSLTAVIGPSGSGKSSLLAVAATLIAPGPRTGGDRRHATPRGSAAAELTTLRRTTIGIVFQQPNLLPSLTAAEQLQVMAHLDGRPPRTARARAGNCWTRSAWPTRPAGARTSCPAASGSGSISPGR